MASPPLGSEEVIANVVGSLVPTAESERIIGKESVVWVLRANLWFVCFRSSSCLLLTWYFKYYLGNK